MRTAINNFFIVCSMTAFLAVLAEGVCGWMYGIREMTEVFEARTQIHTQYDAELGWVNTPGKMYPAYYGLGQDLSIDENGFRRTDEKSDAPLRAVCSGDSFAFGFGVGDTAAWCSQLAQLSPELHTINFGVGGYGVDQAFLRYLRESPKVEHQIHFFTFINEDFERARSLNYRGLGKPGLNLKAGILSAANTPVPKRAVGVPQAFRYLASLEKMSLVRFLHALQGRVSEPEAPKLEVSRARLVFSKMFQELVSFDRARGVRTVFIFLPRADDFEGEPYWRDFVRNEARKLELPYIDLVEKLRELPAERVESFFLPTDRHYTEAGNTWAAAQIITDGLFQSQLKSLQ